MTAPSASTWLAGGGELGQLIRAFDWSRTPLGPAEITRSPAKRNCVMVLASMNDAETPATPPAVNTVLVVMVWSVLPSRSRSTKIAPL